MDNQSLAHDLNPSNNHNAMIGTSFYCMDSSINQNASNRTHNHSNFESQNQYLDRNSQADSPSNSTDSSCLESNSWHSSSFSASAPSSDKKNISKLIIVKEPSLSTKQGNSSSGTPANPLKVSSRSRKSTNSSPQQQTDASHNSSNTLTPASHISRQPSPISTSSTDDSESEAHRSILNSTNSTRSSRSAQTMWVYNLPRDWSEETIKTELQMILNSQTRSELPILSVELKPHLGTDALNRSRATITLRSKEESEAAMQILRHSKIQGKMLSISFNESSHLLESDESSASMKTLFIANVHPAVTEQQIRLLFLQFGPIVSTVVVKNQNSNLSKGFVFVEYADHQSCDLALKYMQNENFCGQPMKIKFAKSQSVPQACNKASIVKSNDMNIPTASKDNLKAPNAAIENVELSKPSTTSNSRRKAVSSKAVKSKRSKSPDTQSPLSKSGSFAMSTIEESNIPKSSVQVGDVIGIKRESIESRSVAPVDLNRHRTSSVGQPIHPNWNQFTTSSTEIANLDIPRTSLCWVPPNQASTIPTAATVPKAMMDEDIAVPSESEDKLSILEEKIIVKKYCRTIVAAFGAWLKELSGTVEIGHWIIKWTAATLFKRYYLYHTLADISPKEIMMGCMLLAAKIEECRLVTVENLHIWRNKNYTISQIIDAESSVADGTFFDLHIFSPFVALSGLFDRLLIKSKESPTSTLKEQTIKLLGEATVRLDIIKDIENLMYTDAMFLFTPASIALAAFTKNPTFKEACSQLLELNVDPAVLPYFSEPSASSEEEKRIETKLEKVRNPLYNRDSKEYKEAQKKKEQEIVQKHNAKTQQIAAEQAQQMETLNVKPIKQENGH